MNSALLKIKSALIALAILSGCTPSTKLTTIEFSMVANGQEVSCNEPVPLENELWHIEQLQFYVSNIEVKTKDKIIPATLVNNDWQNKDVSLLGTFCGGTENWQLHLALPSEVNTIESLSFDIGVPEELNHQNPLKQTTPLNQSDMYWTWQLGHKFFRIDLNNENIGWAFHSGSMGCKAPSPLRPPTEACQFGNRARINLSRFELGKPIQIDIAALVNGVVLNDESRCMSTPDNPSCRTFLTRLGVDAPSVVFKQGK